MSINIDRGDKIKVNKIKFSGNDKISNRKLLKAMKKLREKIQFVFSKDQNILNLITRMI